MWELFPDVSGRIVRVSLGLKLVFLSASLKKKRQVCAWSRGRTRYRKVHVLLDQPERVHGRRP